MRKNRKVISLLLCTALMVCSSAAGMDMERTQAASRGQGALKTVSDEVVQEEPSDVVSGSGAQETEKPETSTSEPEISDEPITSTAPDVEASNEPTETTTPGAVQPTIPPLAPTNGTTLSAVSNSAVYAVGDKLTVANYEYVVVTAPTATTNGTVRLKALVEKAKTKTSLTVPATISKDGNTFSVVGIGTKAFTTSTALKKVIIRKNVQYINTRAFQGVKTLQSVIIGENVTSIKNRAFAGCSSLRSVTIPSKVSLVGIRAFYNCKKLKSVVIESKKITTVKTYAFKYNKKGRYFVMPSGKKSLYQSLIKSSGATVKIYTY